MSAHQILVHLLGDKCVSCGSTQNLHLHHKDGDRKNNNIANIELLCERCHYEKHATNFFIKKNQTDSDLSIVWVERKIKDQLLQLKANENLKTINTVVIKLLERGK